MNCGIKDVSKLRIESPKRISRGRLQRDVYPYYAGFPLSFATAIIETSALPPEALVFDPWSGSGTTLVAASRLGLRSIGQDLNPAMIVVSRARLLPKSEASSIEPLFKDVVAKARRLTHISPDDQLKLWFSNEAATAIRGVERAVSSLLIPKSRSDHRDLFPLDKLSGMASIFLVALFTAARRLSSQLRSSNPTWLKLPADATSKVDVPRDVVLQTYAEVMISIQEFMHSDYALKDGSPDAIVRLADSTKASIQGAADLIVASPPYCTRLDYAAATRLELAILSPLTQLDETLLSQTMMGSTKVPRFKPDIQSNWGATCFAFLEKVRQHPSKASATYYLSTHADYFSKLYSSLGMLQRSLAPRGLAVIVAQDSHYKEVLNDVPKVIEEMCAGLGMSLERKEEFASRNCLSHINSRATAYRRPGSKEAVLCFRKT